MAQWCPTTYAFYARSERGKKQLEELNALLQNILRGRKKSLFNSSFGNGWFGNVIQAVCPETLRVTHDDVICGSDGLNIPLRGSIISIDDYNLEDGWIFVETSSAWAPMPQVWDLVLKKMKYNCVKYKYKAIDQCTDSYINTDSKGEFFNDRYFLQCDLTGIYETYPSAKQLLSDLNFIIAVMRENYTNNPERFDLPNGYNPKRLKCQKSIPKAVYAIQSNIFNSAAIGFTFRKFGTTAT